MFYYTNEWTDGAVRRFLRRFDGDTAFLEDLFLLREADRLASGTKQRTADILEDFKKHIQRVLEQENALKVTDLDINGYDLMQTFQLTPSPLIGKILNYLLEVVLEHPEYNEKSKLIELTRDYLDGKLMELSYSEEHNAEEE
jgi:poly(A) polymerase/tRNA nucleotidyltransferase (CCA-adding enzyme)